MESRTIKGVVHNVFNGVLGGMTPLEEFKHYHDSMNIVTPEIRDWRDMTEEGQWVEADDGGIVQVLKYSPKIKHNKDTAKKSIIQGWCRTVVGTFTIGKYQDMDTDFSKHPDRYRFSGKKDKDAKKDRATRDKCSTKDEMFSFLVCTGKDPYKAYVDVFGIKPFSQIEKEVNFLITRKRIVAKVQVIASELAKKHGIDHDWVMEKVKGFATAEDESVALRAVLKLGDMLGTFNLEKEEEAEKEDGFILGRPKEAPFGLGESEDESMKEIKEAELELEQMESENVETKD